MNPVFQYPAILEGVQQWLQQVDVYIEVRLGLKYYYPCGSMSLAAYELLCAFLYKFPQPLSTKELQVYALTAYGLCLKFWVDMFEDMMLNSCLVHIIKQDVTKTDFINAEWNMLVTLDLDIRKYTEEVLSVVDPLTTG